MARAWWIAILVFATSCGAATQLGVARSMPGAAPTEAAPTADGTAVAATPAGSSTVADAAPAGGGAAADAALAGGEHQTLAVPNVIGKTPDEARALVRAAGFTSDVELDPGIRCDPGSGDPPPREGKVNCQTPDPGKLVRRYAMIQISVATRDQDAERLLQVDLKTVIGLTIDEARQQLKDLGHTGKVTVRVVDGLKGCSADGRVCDYGPTATMTKRDEIQLILSRRKLDISTPAP